MSISTFSQEEKEVVRRASAACFDYFTFDFGARLGVDADEMNDLLEKWPQFEEANEDFAA